MIDLPDSALPADIDGEDDLTALKLSQMIADIMEATGEPREVVTVILNLFLESFVEEIGAGRKVRLNEHGSFRGVLMPEGYTSIRHLT